MFKFRMNLRIWMLTAMSEKTAEQCFDKLVAAEPSAKLDGKVTPINKKAPEKNRFRIQTASDFAAGELDEE